LVVAEHKAGLIGERREVAMAGLAFDDATFIAFVIALVSGIGFGLLGYVITRIVAPPKYLPMKNERFECGNPPIKKGRGLFTMQYYAYLVVFLTVEPVFIYMFLLLMDIRQSFYTVVELFALITLMLIPPIIFGLDSARRISIWTMKEKKKKM
jgi:NADH-quinone oxidoreductase subunit A